MLQTHKKQLLAQTALHIERNPTELNQTLLFSDKSFVENFFFDCSIFNVDGPVSCLCKCRVMGYHNNCSLVLLRKNMKTSFPVFVSKLPVGSSARIIVGLFISARAIATRCC